MKKWSELTSKGRARRLKMRAIKAVAGQYPECHHCGAVRCLQFAHVMPTKLKGQGRGSLHRYCDAIKNWSAYILLCRECHYNYDHPKEN